MSFREVRQESNRRSPRHCHRSHRRRRPSRPQQVDAAASSRLHGWLNLPADRPRRSPADRRAAHTGSAIEQVVQRTTPRECRPCRTKPEFVISSTANTHSRQKTHYMSPELLRCRCFSTLPCGGSYCLTHAIGMLFYRRQLSSHSAKCISVSVGRFREQVINPSSRLIIATDGGQQARKLTFNLFRLPDQLWY